MTSGWSCFLPQTIRISTFTPPPPKRQNEDVSQDAKKQKHHEDFSKILLAQVSAGGVGVLMSTLVPKHHATLATAVVLFVMGGAISEPQVIADAVGVAGKHQEISFQSGPE